MASAFWVRRPRRRGNGDSHWQDGALYGVGRHPSRALFASLLDVGTDNEERLNDPINIGWRHKRVRGQDYDEFV